MNTPYRLLVQFVESNGYRTATFYLPAPEPLEMLAADLMRDGALGVRVEVYCQRHGWQPHLDGCEVCILDREYQEWIDSLPPTEEDPCWTCQRYADCRPDAPFPECSPGPRSECGQGVLLFVFALFVIALLVGLFMCVPPATWTEAWRALLAALS